MQPGLGFAAVVERGFQVHGGDGVVVVEFDVVFAAPDDFDRLARFFR